MFGVSIVIISAYIYGTMPAIVTKTISNTNVNVGNIALVKGKNDNV